MSLVIALDRAPSELSLLILDEGDGVAAARRSRAMSRKIEALAQSGVSVLMVIGSPR